MMVKIRVRPGKRKEFMHIMNSLQDDKKKEKGIYGSKMEEDAENANRFDLVDEWETHEDLERYRRGDNFRVFLGALKTLCAETEIDVTPLRTQGGDASQEKTKEA